MKNINLIFFILILQLHLKAQSDANFVLSLPMVLDSIERIMEKQHIPGLLLTMATRDSVLYDGGLGISDIDEDRKIDSRQLFRMGSITKTFAALAMLKLEAAGHFSLNDRLADRAPEVPFSNKWEESHPVRLVHLLEHTTGFDDMHFKAIYNKGDKELPALDMVMVHKESLTSRWPPGTRMSYCNPGYVILTYLIEKYSGQTYHEFIQHNFFDPIGMASSNFVSFPENSSDYAQGYRYEGKQFSEVPFYAIHGGLAGTLNSCGADMAKYIQLYLNDGLADGERVIPSGWIKRMETATSSLAARKGRKQGNYGLANYSAQFRERFPFQGHNGGIDGFSSVFNYNSELGLGFALSNNSNGRMGEIETLIIDYLTRDFTVPAPPASSLDTSFVQAYLGYYHPENPRDQITYPMTQYWDGFELKLINDTLNTVPIGGNGNKLIPAGGHLFRPENTNSATALLTQNEAGDRVFIGRRYYERASKTAIWLKRIWYVAAHTLTFTFFLFGLIWLIIQVVDKKKSYATSAIKGLFMSSFCFISMVVFFLIVVENSEIFGEMNWKSVLYFLSSLGFPVGSLAGSYFLFKNYSFIQSKSLKYYLLLVAFCMISLSVYYCWYGFVGLRFWAY